MLKKAIAGENPLEISVFELQDKLRVASRIEGRPATIEALLAVTEFLSVISGPGERLHQRPLFRAHKLGRRQSFAIAEAGKPTRRVKKLCRQGKR